MRKVDIGIGFFFTLFGLLALLQAQRLAFFQRNGIPGPGFFPTTIALALSGLGVALVVSRLRGTPSQFGTFSLPGRTSLARVLGVWATIGVSVALLELVGFVGAMLLLTAFLLLGIERLYTWRAMLTIMLVPLFFYLLFDILLNVRLPKGIWSA